MNQQWDQNTLYQWMLEEDPSKLQELYKVAYEVKKQEVGTKVYYRGIIEFSNYCRKNCYYCGIRRDNTAVHRYIMDKKTILDSARWAYENRYGSLVLQSGERQDEEFVAFVEDVIVSIKNLSHGELGITLSLGEQSKEVYERWFKAGAHRYLLRIETSSPKIYADIHPADHVFDERLRALLTLKDIGYQVGTGVMIGLPGQTEADLVNDILFFESMDIDMIGMGPYLSHEETPLTRRYPISTTDLNRNFTLGLKMIALSRLYLRNINIAATTALQAIQPNGREQGLKAGANIMMPIITDTAYRKDYLLYENKPCTEDTSDDCKQCLAGRVFLTGETVGYGEWGDSPHFLKKQA